jgi:ABC-2 type transport system ATP-binding protein
MVEIKSISKSFKEDFWKKSNKVIDNVSFDIKENNITGFVGKNGCGKTTTIKIILKLIRPDLGKVSFSKEMGESSHDIFNQIGYLPESPRFFENLNGYKFLETMGKFHGLNGSKLRDRIYELGDIFELTSALDRKIGKYSKGMRQKVGFIAAVVHQPKLVILDEPLSGLDPRARSIFKEYFLSLKKSGSTIFMTSHILEDLFEVGDNIIYMSNGKVEEQKVNFIRSKDLIIKIKNHPSIDIDSKWGEVSKKGTDTIIFIVNDQNREKFILDINVAAEDIISIKEKPYCLPDID